MLVNNGRSFTPGWISPFFVRIEGINGIARNLHGGILVILRSGYSFGDKQGRTLEVVCLENRIRDILPQELLPCREAIGLALEETR